MSSPVLFINNAIKSEEQKPPIHSEDRSSILKVFKHLLKDDEMLIKDQPMLDQTCFKIIKKACEKNEWPKIFKVRKALKGLVSPKGRSLFFQYIHDGNVEQIRAICLKKLHKILSDGQSAYSLHEAANAGKLKSLQILKKMKCGKLTTKNEKGRIPLHLALKKDKKEMISGLLPIKDRFNVPYPTKQGEETCLHLLIRKRNLPLLTYLLDKYPDDAKLLFLKKDHSGFTPLQLASYDSEIFNLLKQFGDKYQLDCSPQKINLSEVREDLKISLPNFIKEPAENLVFQGGGPKGLIYIGVIQALEELKYGDQSLLEKAKRIAGTSAGAIQALVLALGCNSKYLQELAEKISLKKMLDDLRLFDRIERFQSNVESLSSQYTSLSDLSLKDIFKIANFDKMTLMNIKWKLDYQNGLFSTKKFEDEFEKTILAKSFISNLTFGELGKLVRKGKRNADGSCFKHLHVFATKIINQDKPEVVHFSSEDPRCSNIVISSAVACSICIPGFFKTCYLGYKDHKKTVTRGIEPFFDGGLVYNLPVDAFDQLGFLRDDIPNESKILPIFNHRTLCFSISSAPKDSPKSRPSFLEVLLSGSTVFRGVDKLVAARNPYNSYRIIDVDPQGIGLFDFGITLKDTHVQQAINSAYNKVHSFFENQNKAQEVDEQGSSSGLKVLKGPNLSKLKIKLPTDPDNQEPDEVDLKTSQEKKSENLTKTSPVLTKKKAKTNDSRNKGKQKIEKDEELSSDLDEPQSKTSTDTDLKDTQKDSRENGEKKIDEKSNPNLNPPEKELPTRGDYAAEVFKLGLYSFGLPIVPFPNVADIIKRNKHVVSVITEPFKHHPKSLIYLPLTITYKARRLKEYDSFEIEGENFFWLVNRNLKIITNVLFDRNKSVFFDPKFPNTWVPCIAIADDGKTLNYLNKKGIKINVESTSGPLIFEVLFYNCNQAFKALLTAKDYDDRNGENRLRDAHWNTILHVIAGYGKETAYDMLKQSQKLTPLLNEKNAVGETAILVAAEEKKFNIVKKLMEEKEIDLVVAHPKSGKTLLHFFAERGLLEDFNKFIEIAKERNVLEEIIALENKNGLPFDEDNEETKKGQSDSILFATTSTSILEQLISMGIDLDKKQSKTNKTFPYLCVGRKNLELLSRYCTEFKKKHKKNLRYRKFLDSHVNSSVGVKKSALTLAAQKDYYEILKFLLLEKVDYKKKVADKTPLEWAKTNSKSYMELEGLLK